MTTLLALLACTVVPRVGDPDGTPAIPTDCTSVTGTGSIALVWRADVSVLVPPAEAPTGMTAALSLAGPDALGRYYVVEPSGVVKRSDDGGCSWAAVGTLPDGGMDTGWDTGPGPQFAYYDLFAAPASGKVYAYTVGKLYGSADGASWEELGSLLLQPPATIAIDPTNAERLRGYAREGMLTSTDGGRTWSTTAVPDREAWYNVAIDAADVGRVALSRRGLWVATDGVAWQDRGIDANMALAWDDGALYAMNHGDEHDADYHLRRSDDLGVHFSDLPIGNDPELSVSTLAADGGLAVTGGYRYVSGEDVSGIVQLTTASDNTVHRVPGYEGVHGVAFGDDRVIVALMGPSVATPD